MNQNSDKWSDTMNKVINYGLKALFLAGIITSVAQAWHGRVLPVAFDKNKGKWSILLGLNKNGYWNDFGAEASKGTKGNVVAQDALKNQTNSVYNVQIQGAPWFKLANDDIIHFVPVKFISGGDLYKTARTSIKEDFRWVSEDELTGQGDVSLITRVRGAAKNVNVSRGLLEYFRQYWPQARTRLSSQTPTPQTPTVSTPASTQTGKWAPALNSGAIYFYTSGQPYYEFTNFQTGYPINLDGKQWPTTEHYYQAQKFTNKQLQEQIRTAATPRQAFDMARKNKSQERSDWRQVNLEMMLKAVRAKFNQHAKLKNMLLNTGNKNLIEDAGQNDAFFGAGADYNGDNYLGRILMHVRGELDGTISANTPWAQSLWQ